MIKKTILSSLFLAFLFLSNAQNTVGVTKYTDEVSDGYTFFYGMADSSVHLINNCGEEVHRWNLEKTHLTMAYLLDNGDLLRTRSNVDIISTGGVGNGGRLERYDWEGNLLWNYEVEDTIYRFHHDIQPLPNGNILTITYERIFPEQLRALGRDTNTINQEIYMETIFEIEPIGSDSGHIVWEWHARDHLVQDLYPSLPNFGIIKENKNKINVNYGDLNRQSWLHFNSIHYNDELDQILLSSRTFSEIFIIDHSTTTTEASTSLGGNFQRGGDLLYRWGNPKAYDINEEQQIFGQHDAQWLKQNNQYTGEILLFNNGQGRPDGNYSTIDIVIPTIQNNTYQTLNDSLFFPAFPEVDYIANLKESFLSGFISGVDKLENGNLLICEGDDGRLFEVNQNDSIVWEYISPVSSQGTLSQGDEPIGNLIFKTRKYPKTYEAFGGKSFIQNPIQLEQNPNEPVVNCKTVGLKENITTSNLSIFPVPVSNTLFIDSDNPIKMVYIYDILGNEIYQKKIKQNSTSQSIDVSTFKNGYYFLKINNQTKSFIKNSY